ncbi:MAG: hypothetical protein ACRDP6_00860, partial [Actinoallomurus sp.]
MTRPEEFPLVTAPAGGRGSSIPVLAVLDAAELAEGLVPQAAGTAAAEDLRGPFELLACRAALVDVQVRGSGGQVRPPAVDVLAG